jgi:hypothetical protein
MKTMMLATAAVLALGVGSAFAGEGGPVENSPFTRNTVVAQASSVVVADQQAAHMTTLVAGRTGTTSLFPPDGNGGANS